jgi:hypothetical protein
MYSHELDVPIYFTSNSTGSDLPKRQDWDMEYRMDSGVCTRVSGRNLSVLYLVDEKAKRLAFSFAFEYVAVKSLPDCEERDDTVQFFNEKEWYDISTHGVVSRNIFYQFDKAKNDGSQVGADEGL